MTFQEVTKMMLNSMDFFELRRTAARYTVPYQGVRRQKLIRDLERKILAKSAPQPEIHPEAVDMPTVAETSPQGAVSAKPKMEGNRNVFRGPRINTFSTRTTAPRQRA